MFCPNCGAEQPENQRFCGNCGSPMAVLAEREQGRLSKAVKSFGKKDKVISCPSCGGTDIQVQLVEQGQQTTRRGVGLGGHINNTARGVTAIATLGISNLVWKKSQGTNKTKTLNATMGVCQSCGYSWTIRRA